MATPQQHGTTVSEDVTDRVDSASEAPLSGTPTSCWPIEMDTPAKQAIYDNQLLIMKCVNDVIEIMLGREPETSIATASEAIRADLESTVWHTVDESLATPYENLMLGCSNILMDRLTALGKAILEGKEGDLDLITVALATSSLGHTLDDLTPVERGLLNNMEVLIRQVNNVIAAKLSW